LICLNAGYYPTLEDLAKIVMLYQRHGEHRGEQILHRQLTLDLLAARGSLGKGGEVGDGKEGGRDGRYLMGFHFKPYTSPINHKTCLLPMMWASGESEVVFYPNGLASIVISKGLRVPSGVRVRSGDENGTARAVERLKPF
jgi:hypothetical protein